MFKVLQQIWHSKDLRKKILFTLAIIAVYRFMTHITIPEVNKEALQYVFDKNSLLGAFSLLTGGSAENFSIVLMGLSPYINASIIVQLLTVIVPRLEEISKEGEQGRKRLNRWTRWLTFPLAFLQSYGMITLLNSQAQVPIIENISDPLTILPIMFVISAGTVVLMWLGEVMTEKGIGNGTSVLIFAGIVAAMPTVIGPTLKLAQTEPERLLPMVAMLLFALLFTLIVVMFTEGQRRIPVTYAGQRGRAKAQQSFLPIRVNQAGMIPIIFAVSLVTFPSIIGQFLLYADSEWVKSIGRFTTSQFNSQSWTYIIVYFLLVIAFTYFYVSIVFNPDQIADNIQKRGGFVAGLRPGKETSEYLAKVSNRMNLFGGSMIALVAVLPIVLQLMFAGLSMGGVPSVISGAGVIIVVGVVLELIRQVNAQLLTHHYERFYKG
ncbi:preprotein translocase subunit SecY [Candidatus Peregrinibacteria bacterium RIFCSPLOWO2_02_FULL_48_14]|nr:MAG: preprotein translocase subunit SecY [Candidatus Peregrinibacteria bacterium RIFCSPLOWO2_02_FULL_48_14]